MNPLSQKDKKMDNRVVVRLPICRRIDYLNGMEKEQMNQSEFLIHLLENYYGDNLSVLRNFRYNLRKRVKKGINQLYINELIKLRDYINTILNNYD